MKPAKQWLAAGLVLGMTVVTASMPAQAELLSVQGVGILDTEQNIIWLQDANLLNTLEDTTTASYNALVAAIIAANKGVVADSPDFYDGDSRQYTLTAADFQPGGTATYWGALAFVKYLNITRYRGSNNWTLPRVGGDMTLGYNQTGDAYGKLFYNELRRTAGSAMPVGPFHKVSDPYWFGSEYALNANFAWNSLRPLAFNGSRKSNLRCLSGRSGQARQSRRNKSGGAAG